MAEFRLEVHIMPLLRGGRFFAHACFVSGVELNELQAEDEPLWTHRLPELRNCFARRLSVCIWWQGQISSFEMFSRVLS